MEGLQTETLKRAGLTILVKKEKEKKPPLNN